MNPGLLTVRLHHRFLATACSLALPRSLDGGPRGGTPGWVSRRRDTHDIAHVMILCNSLIAAASLIPSGAIFLDGGRSVMAGSQRVAQVVTAVSGAVYTHALVTLRALLPSQSRRKAARVFCETLCNRGSEKRVPACVVVSIVPRPAAHHIPRVVILMCNTVAGKL